MTRIAVVDLRQTPGGLARSATAFGRLDPDELKALTDARVPIEASALAARHGGERIQALARAGWLVDVEAAASRGAPDPVSDAIIGIPSRARPDKLRTLLADLAPLAGERPVRVALDGTPEEVAENRRICAASGIADLRVSTPDTRAEAADALAGPAQIARPLLRGGLAAGPAGQPVSRDGGSRNSLLLEAGQRAVLFLDDDVRPVGHNLSGAPHWNGMPGPFLRDPDVAEDHLEPVDLFAPLDVLGRRPIDLVPLAGAWDRLDPASLRALCFRDPAVVALSSGGLLGDEGSTSIAYRLFLGPPLLDRLRDEPDAWMRWRTTRRGRRASDGLCVSPAPDWMTAWAGVDTRGVIPPFQPLGRGADGLFASTLRALRPNALLAGIPAAVHHLPPERPVPPDDTVHGALFRHVSSFLGQALPALSRAPSPSATTRLRRLGHELLSQAEGDPQDIANRWLAWQTQEDARLHDVLRARRRDGPDIPAWQADADAVLARLEASLRAPTLRTPHDLNNMAPDRPETWRVVGRIAMVHGAMVLGWERLREAWSTVPSPYVAP